MVVCTVCGKENQQHYKFCLGCGAAMEGMEAGGNVVEQPPAASVAPTLFAAQPLNQDGAADAPTDAPPSPTATAEPISGAAESVCPSCGASSPPNFKFCGNCGASMNPAGTGSGTGPQSGKNGVSADAATQMPHTAAGTTSATVARLTLIRPDGSEGGYHECSERDVTLGRITGALFEQDGYLSPRHARFQFADESVTITDMGSLNGVFVRITEAESLSDGSIFRVGQELLRFNAMIEPRPLEDGTEVLGSPNPGYWGLLSLIASANVDGCAFPLASEEVFLGRERGDVVFNDDGYVSATHAKLSRDASGTVLLEDLGSSNGTFLRLENSRQVPFGTYILMGQQLFRIDRIG